MTTLEITQSAQLKSYTQEDGSSALCWELLYQIANPEIADIAYYGVSVLKADYPAKEAALASQFDTARAGILAAVQAEIGEEYF